MWYFTGEGSDAVEYRRTYSAKMALGWAFKYHAGSMAMGSFLVATATIVRLVFEFIIYQYEKANPGTNPIWKVIKACLRFIGWAMDCCVKFVNKNAYIQIALRNQSFCPAAKASFYLAIRNAARSSAVGIISGIIAVLGKGFIVAACAFMTISITESTQPDIKQPYIVALLVSFWAYMVASIFLSLFEDSAITILYCFILDEEHGGSTRTPDSLRPFLDMADEKFKERAGEEGGEAPEENENDNSTAPFKMPSLAAEMVGPLRIGAKYEFTASQNLDRVMMHTGIDGGQEVHMDIRSEQEHRIAAATWKIVPGLNGMPDTVSIQSEDYPNWHVRHAGYVCWAHDTEDADLYRQDATFRVHEQDDKLVYFESVNYPGHFIKIDHNDGFRNRITPEGGLDTHYEYKEILA